MTIPPRRDRPVPRPPHRSTGAAATAQIARRAPRLRSARRAARRPPLVFPTCPSSAARAMRLATPQNRFARESALAPACCCASGRRSSVAIRLLALAPRRRPHLLVEDPRRDQVVVVLLELLCAVVVQHLLRAEGHREWGGIACVVHGEEGDGESKRI